MKIIPYNFSLITDQQHATFERQGWGIFNGNEVERIDDLLDWINDNYNLSLEELPKGFKQLNSDTQAIKKARENGFVVEENEYGYNVITGIIVDNY